MNIFDLLMSFWQEGEREPFTTTEAALYHYLLYEANRNRWMMPIRCSTVLICHRLSTTKQNIQKARDALKERGFIDFKVGTGKRKPAEYTLLQLSGQLSHQLSHQLSQQLTVQLPLYNIKDKDKNNNNTTSHDTEGELLSLSLLQEKLQADTDWKMKIISLIEGKGKKIELPDLSLLVEQFFGTLSIKGVESKTDSDCRSHFFNWVCKQLDTPKTTSHAKCSSLRRGVDVPSAPEQNYEGAF